MVKTFKEFIAESIWSDIQDRSRGKIERKENEIVSNIKKLKPVDMGVSVFWADRDLESDENVYFSFQDTKKIIKNSGWRLPTFNEISELNTYSTMHKNTFEECELHANDNDLIFDKCGYKRYADDEVINPDAYYAWTSTAYVSIKINRYLRLNPMNCEDRCCVRLVKDK